jgi:hypothetical protein
VESDEPSAMTPDDEVTDEGEENGDSEQVLIDRLNRRTFVVASRNLQSQPHWISVSEVFRSSDAAILEPVINFCRIEKKA